MKSCLSAQPETLASSCYRQGGRGPTTLLRLASLCHAGPIESFMISHLKGLPGCVSFRCSCCLELAQPIDPPGSSDATQTAPGLAPGQPLSTARQY